MICIKPQVSYRIADLEDTDLLAQMNQELIEDEHSHNPMSLEELVTRMRQFLAGEWNAAIFLWDNQPVGYVLYLIRNSVYDAAYQEVFIRQYYIKREFRQQGIGKRGIELLEEELFPQQSTLVIDVLSANEAGQRFWKAIGFQPYYINMKKRREAHL